VYIKGDKNMKIPYIFVLLSYSVFAIMFAAGATLLISPFLITLTDWLFSLPPTHAGFALLFVGGVGVCLILIRGSK